MMVRTSMGVDIDNVSIHGWADNAYMTPSCLPSYVNHALPALVPAPSRYLTDPELRKATYNVFIHESPWRWPFRGRRTHSIPKRLREKKKPRAHLWTELTFKAKFRTYLVPIAVSVFKVGCRVEQQLRELLASHCLRELPSFP